MPHPPAVLLVQTDAGVRAGLAAGLRLDGMDVVEFAAAEPRGRQAVLRATWQRGCRAAKSDALNNPVRAA